MHSVFTLLGQAGEGQHHFPEDENYKASISFIHPAQVLLDPPGLITYFLPTQGGKGQIGQGFLVYSVNVPMALGAAPAPAGVESRGRWSWLGTSATSRNASERHLKAVGVVYVCSFSGPILTSCVGNYNNSKVMGHT